MKNQIIHLELDQFKITFCQMKSAHNHKQCIYFHGPKDRRRKGVYSSEMCSHAENGQNGISCPLGDNCNKSHNKVESLYNNEKYKKKFCTLYPGNCDQCEYGIYCSFAHTDEDITCDLIHHYIYDTDFYMFQYKTVWCPFNYINHDRSNCVYAHNWQDYRRKPNEFYYEPQVCSFWKPNEFITKYETGCPNKFQCNKCHGWKELEYHPKMFKTKQCSLEPNCTKESLCPYFHNKNDKREEEDNSPVSPKSDYPHEVQLKVQDQKQQQIRINEQESSPSSQTVKSIFNNVFSDY